MYQLKNRSWWAEVFFYFSVVLLSVVVLAYAMFAYKYYLQSQKIDEINKKIAVYGTLQQKAEEKEVFNYKDKIEDFSKILENRRIVSNVFDFMEKNTLPNIRFSVFDMSDSSSEVRLSGEAGSMLAISRQIQVFEENKNFVKRINVLSSQVVEGGKVKFVLNFSLNPEIFSESFSELK